jgi:hypothetical protein
MTAVAVGAICIKVKKSDGSNSRNFLVVDWVGHHHGGPPVA